MEDQHDECRFADKRMHAIDHIETTEEAFDPQPTRGQYTVDTKKQHPPETERRAEFVEGINIGRTDKPCFALPADHHCLDEGID